MAHKAGWAVCGGSVSRMKDASPVLGHIMNAEATQRNESSGSKLKISAQLLTTDAQTRRGQGTGPGETRKKEEKVAGRNAIAARIGEAE